MDYEFVPGEVSRVAARIIDSDVTQLRPDPPRSSLLARQGEQQLCTIPTGKEEEEGGSEARNTNVQTCRNLHPLDLCDFILLVWRKLQ